MIVVFIAPRPRYLVGYNQVVDRCLLTDIRGVRRHSHYHSIYNSPGLRSQWDDDVNSGEPAKLTKYSIREATTI